MLIQRRPKGNTLATAPEPEFLGVVARSIEVSRYAA